MQGTRNDRSFGWSIIYTDTFHNAILFIDTSTILDKTKLFLELERHIFPHMLRLESDVFSRSSSIMD